MRAHVILAAEVLPAGNVTQLPDTSAGNGGKRPHFHAYAGTVRQPPLAPNGQPGICVSIIAVESADGVGSARDHDVEATVVIVVTPCRRKRAGGIGPDHTAGFAIKRAVAIVTIEEVSAGAVGHKEVEKTIVIIIAPGPAGRAA